MNEIYQTIEQKEAIGEPRFVDDLLEWCHGDDSKRRKLVQALEYEILPWSMRERMVIEQGNGWGAPNEPIPEPTKISYEPVDPEFFIRIAEEVQEKHNIHPADPRFTEFMSKKLLEESSPITVEPDDFRQWINETFPHGKATKIADGTEGNHFNLEGEIWNISFNGTRLQMKDNKSIRTIAELLQHPNEEKKYISFQPDHEQSGDPVKGKTQYAGKIVDQKTKYAIQNKVDELNTKLVELLLKGKDNDEVRDLEGQLEKIKKLLASSNATIKDNGKIKWGVYLDQGELKKQKHAHRQRLTRAIERIEKKENGKELAKYLQENVLKWNYFVPLPDDPPWTVFY